ncbi:LexA family protein [Robbsia andropogonis]|uniref:LexA family protein n=1 Tax=Robbsia andropogonis TaxID=28092 RepID=UPI003D1F3845
MEERILHMYLHGKYQSNQIKYYDCDMNNFAGRVKARRKELDLSQDALAKLAGVSQSTVAQIESSRNQGSKHLVALARALNVEPEWLDNGTGDVGGDLGPAKAFDKNVAPAPPDTRRIPVLSYVQAGQMTEMRSPFSTGDVFEYLMTDLDLSEYAFGLVIRGDSMTPEFNEGDRALFDPALQPRPGDFVVAKNGDEEATFKKYRPRGTSVTGQEVFELAPLNDDYPTMRSDTEQLTIIGVMVEHRRYRRR